MVHFVSFPEKATVKMSLSVRALVPGSSRNQTRVVISGRSGPRHMDKSNWSGWLTVLTLKDLQKDTVNLTVWTKSEQDKDVYFEVKLHRVCKMVVILWSRVLIFTWVQLL